MRDILCVVSVILVGAGAYPQMNQAMIEAVRSDREKVAKASWWGFDAEDATACLQDAINSGAEKLIVENMGAPWIVRPIQLASNQEIVFEEGVVVEAKRGEFKGITDSLFTARDVENIVLRGYGATFRMHKADYQSADYAEAEWRHTLNLRGAKNVKILGLTLMESGGDGIYVGCGSEGGPCIDITIKDVVCAKHHRQGISVITARNLLIENTVMRDTSGTPPMAGIDFEPNRAQEELVNCVMRNCVSENNQGDGYDFSLPNLNASSAPISIRLENCRSIGNNRAFTFTTGNTEEAALDGSAEFINCTFEGSRASAIFITGKPADRCPMRFVRCSVVNCGVNQEGQSPIVFEAWQDNVKPLGGVEFVDCTIVDPIERRPIIFRDYVGDTHITDITGALILERGGRRERLQLTEELLDEWMPSRKFKAIAPFDMSGVSLVPFVTSWSSADLAGAMRLRNACHLLMFANEGEAVSFTVRYAQVGGYGGEPMPVRVRTPSGVEVLQAKGEFMVDTTFEFVAPETGIYEISLDPGRNTAQVTHSTHPFCMAGGEAPIHFLGTTGDVFFYVPKSVREFGVKIFGEGSREGVRAALYDSHDTLIDERDDITEPYQFVVERDPTDNGEVWRLHLAKPTSVTLEDFHILLQGIPCLLAPVREALLVPANG
ncbi:MAG: right-handed parallel beta-helix repeat-containing protein [Candidatus Zipacnadales bacterium]